MSDRGEISPVRIETLRAQQAAQSQMAAKYSVVQEASAEEFSSWADYNAINIFAARSNFVPLKKKAREEDSEEKRVEKKNKLITQVRKFEEAAERLAKRNPEFHVRSLLALKSYIQEDDSQEEILRKVLDNYPDLSLADEALDFLIETSEKELQQTLRNTKNDFNTRSGREITAGRNMGTEARAFSEQGLGSPTALRDLYRDITGNPRETTTLFDQLAVQFPYSKMKTVIDFIMHALGSDLKSKGPSIARAELHRLMTESRTLGAILGVYRFFLSRMGLIEASFKRSGLTLPGRMNFELLSRLFVKFLEERYPNTERLLKLAAEFGLEEYLGEIIVYTQMRDAVRQVAPRLFKSELHRQEILRIYIDTLEELEDLYEQGEEKGKKKKKKDEEEKKEEGSDGTL